MKLKAKGKLSLGGPNLNLSGAYLRKSESHYGAARLLKANCYLEEAVAMAYYSMYHALTALFLSIGLRCENHALALRLLTEVFGIDNSGIISAQRERVDKEYYVDKAISDEKAGEALEKAHAFCLTMSDRISRMNARSVLLLRKKARLALRIPGRA